MISIVIVIFKLYTLYITWTMSTGHPSGPQPVMEADILMIIKISMMNIVMIVTITDD